MSDKSFDILLKDTDIKISSEKFNYTGCTSFGGKVAGLSFAKKIIENFPSSDFPGIELKIPKYWVIDSHYYDLFLERNNLRTLAENYENDLRVTQAFDRASLPTEIMADLWEISKRIDCPLAVRSSNILEGDPDNPVVGLYGTKILSNSLEDQNIRFENLIDAIKFIYSTAFHSKAKKYFSESKRNLNSEKIAVLIQKVTGSRYGDFYYPNISGVLKTHDYYVSGNRKPEDRVVNICLGLGKTIDDKNYSWRYSPKYPKKAPPFNSNREMLNKTQTKFWAINVGNKSVNSVYENEYLTHFDLTRAEEDGTLKLIASTYNPEYDKVMMGMRINGPRVLNFSTLLKLNDNKLNEFIEKIAEVSEKVFGCPIRIEFTLDFKSKWEFSIVQIRPMGITEEKIDLVDKYFPCHEILLRGDHVLGNGSEDDISDIVFIDPFKFDKAKSPQIAQEIDRFNQYLVNSEKKYLFIGFGRIGSTDSWLGIPVDWKSLSGAGVIVESTHTNVNAQMSKGAHFYQNLSIHKVKYFSVADDLSNNIDWEWINSQKLVNQTEFVKHISLRNPIKVLVDGRNGTGVILK